MSNLSNDLDGDPSSQSVKQKTAFFETIKERGVSKSLSSINVFPRKENPSSNSDNKSPVYLTSEPVSASPQENGSNSNSVKKSTSDNLPNTSSSFGNCSPSPTHPILHSTVIKSKKIQFGVEVPEILEVFTDLDRFIDQELNAINCNKRIKNRLSQDPAYSPSKPEAFRKLKQEYLKDKQRVQRELECQPKQIHKTLPSQEEFSMSQCGGDDGGPRSAKIEKLKVEIAKQESLLTKISQLLDLALVEDRNIQEVMKIERHYLVCGCRLQAALGELKKIQEQQEPLHPTPFNCKGLVRVSEIILEMDHRNFQRANEFFVVILKHEEGIYATKPISSLKDVRTIKFPEEFSLRDVYGDFEVRLEVYGTTFWRKRPGARETMLKKYGFVNFSLMDSSEKTRRLEMVEVIRSEHNPLRKKVLLKIHQTITSEVKFKGVLLVKLDDLWCKAVARLCGHILEIRMILRNGKEDDNPMLLDLKKFDADFVIPVMSRISQRPFTFLLKFNREIHDGDFSLLVAAQTDYEYQQWVRSINKSLALMN